MSKGSLIQEVKDNVGFKSKYVVASIRLSQMYYSHGFLYAIFVLHYKFVIDFLLGVEIPPTVKIGSGLKISHAKNITIHPNAMIGENCHLRHGLTIGNNGYSSEAPTLGNNVNLGCNVTIIGNVSVGDNVIVGANTLILKDVPSNCIVHEVKELFFKEKS